MRTELSRKSAHVLVHTGNTNMRWCTSEYKQTAQVYLKGLRFSNGGFQSSQPCQDGTCFPYW